MIPKCKAIYATGMAAQYLSHSLRQHVHRPLTMSWGRKKKSAGIYNPEAINAEHPAAAVKDSSGICDGAHLTGSSSIVDWI